MRLVHGISVDVSASLSAGDWDNIELAQQYSGIPTIVGECTLTHKHNAASMNATHLDPDYCLLIDSDDLLSDGFWDGVARKMKQGAEYAGVSDFYVFDINTRRQGRWVGYPSGNPRHGEAIGVGKLWSSRVMDAVNWRLWPESDKLSGMDGLSHKRVVDAGFKAEVCTCDEWGGIPLDLKSDTNMWSFNRLPLVESNLDLHALFPELRPWLK